MACGSRWCALREALPQGPATRAGRGPKARACRGTSALGTSALALSTPQSAMQKRLFSVSLSHGS